MMTGRSEKLFRCGTSGKGHGEVPQGGSQGGKMFVTPPSHRQAEGRGQGRRSDGTMPMSATPTEKKSLGGQGKVTEGPLPPKVTAKASVSEPDHLQRAFEAEMVTFLREQNELLTSEVAELKRQQTMQGRLLRRSRRRGNVWMVGWLDVVVVKRSP